MKEWLSNFDRKMQGRNRKVIFFLDDETSYLHLNLQNIKLAFFPQNVTSTCRPLDLGFIKNSNLENKKPNVTVLEAVMWTTAAIKKNKQGNSH